MTCKLWILFTATIFVSLTLFQTIHGVTFVCNTSPSNLDNQNVVDGGDTLSISCDISDSNYGILACIWRHVDPISFEEDGMNSPNAINCIGTPGNSGSACQDDSRVIFKVNGSECAIDVLNTKPEDTGNWYMTAVYLSNHNPQPQVGIICHIK